MRCLVVACIAQNLSTSQRIMFFDPKPVNPWHSRKKMYPGVFYRLVSHLWLIGLATAPLEV
jgi:hypothetical protein